MKQADRGSIPIKSKYFATILCLIQPILLGAFRVGTKWPESGVMTRLRMWASVSSFPRTFSRGGAYLNEGALHSRYTVSCNSPDTRFIFHHGDGSLYVCPQFLQIISAKTSSLHFLSNPFDTTCSDLRTVSVNKPPSSIVFVGGGYDRSSRTYSLSWSWSHYLSRNIGNHLPDYMFHGAQDYGRNYHIYSYNRNWILDKRHRRILVGHHCDAMSALHYYSK
jgi:hypothetical protein